MECRVASRYIGGAGRRGGALELCQSVVMSPGNPGISPARREYSRRRPQERSLDPLILGPVGNIPGRREIFPARSGISPAGGDIPGPHWEYPRPAGISPARSVISRAGGEYPRPPLGTSPAGGNIPGPAHREYPRPREYSRPIENIPAALTPTAPLRLRCLVWVDSTSCSSDDADDPKCITAVSRLTPRARPAGQPRTASMAPPRALADG